MAKCKICKTNIPDGIEYCDNCEDKKGKVSNESYLDSLLNSVKNTTPLVENVYKKKSKENLDIKPGNQQRVQDKLDNTNDIDELNSPEIVSNNQIEDDWQDYVAYSIDVNDIEDFNNYNLEEDLSDIDAEDLVSDEELFGQDISELMKEFDKDNQEFFEENGTDNIVKTTELAQEDIEPEIIPESINYEESVEDFYNSSNRSEQEIQEEILVDQNLQSEINNSQADAYDIELSESSISQLTKDEQVSVVNDRHNEDQILEDIPEYDRNHLIEDIPALEDEEFDPDLNHLLNSFNMMPDDYYSNMEGQAEDKGEEKLVEDNTSFDTTQDFDQMGTDEDEFLSILSQISSDDPVSEDVRAINDLLQGKSVEPIKNDSMPSNVGEVFSDALKGISSLTDLEAEEEELINQIPDKKGKKAKKAKNEKKSNKQEGADEGKPKKGILQLLFGNVKKEKKKKVDSIEEADALKADREETSPKAKVKKSKGKADPSSEEAGSGKKVKKGKKGAVTEGEEGGNVKVAKKKKEKKKKSREIIQVIDDIEEDEGRINRLGATIVFLFFGLLVTLIIVGTNTVSYTLSIEKATDYFDNREYTDAYNQVYGMEIKDEDFAIYNKIMTVMYVNKQLNSYNNFYSIGQYPQALDSLLKGLRRYDKYIELATMLGIENDLKYVRKQILAELKNEFNLSQKQAMKIISYDNMENYSLAVYDVVDKNISN
jgi:hypothetical protein